MATLTFKQQYLNYLSEKHFFDKCLHVLDILYPECKDNGISYFKKGDIVADNKGNIVLICDYTVIDKILFYKFLSINTYDVVSLYSSSTNIDLLANYLLEKAMVNKSKLINCKNNEFTLLVSSNDKLSFFAYYCSENYMPVNRTNIVNSIYPTYFEKNYIKLNAILKNAPYVFINEDNKYLIDMNIEKHQLVFSDNIKFAPIYTLSDMRAIISYKKYPYFNSLLKHQKLSIFDVKQQKIVI